MRGPMRTIITREAIPPVVWTFVVLCGHRTRDGREKEWLGHEVASVRREGVPASQGVGPNRAALAE